MDTTKVTHSNCCKLAFALIFLIACTTGVASQPTNVQNGTTYLIPCEVHHNSTQEECQNKTLERIAANAEKDSDVRINIRSSYTLELTSQVNFTNINSLAISGLSGIARIDCTNATLKGAGIFLGNISGKVTLKNLNVTGCGYATTLVEDKSTEYSSALTMVHCSNIDIYGLFITNSKGIGLIIIAYQYNYTETRISIASTNFEGNKLPPEYLDKSMLGGGGIYIELNSVFDDSNVTHSFTEISFDNCMFEENVQMGREYNHLFTTNTGHAQQGFGRGGGAYLNIENGCKNVHAMFTDCRFIRNQAFIGGGLSVKVYSGTEERQTSNIRISIKDTLFDHNGCDTTKKAGFGGGVHISFRSFLEASTISDSHYMLENVRFTDNCAEIGGALFYTSNGDSLNCNRVSSVLIANCTFFGNTAHIGSAVELTPNVFKKIATNGNITPTFRNCEFINNSVSTGNSSQYYVPLSPRIGTIYASLINIRFEGHNHFENNLGTAIYIVNGVLHFQNSSASFIKNTGYHGGAISLIGSSAMIIGPQNYDFIGNKALYHGGAIYVELSDTTDFIMSRSCFLKYANEDSEYFSGDWNNVNLTFEGNRARDNSAGHAIYTTSLYPCQVIRNGTVNNRLYTLINVTEVFTTRGAVFYNNPPQVATDGAIIHRENQSPLMVIPGKKHRHGVTVRDDLGQEVTARFRATLLQNEEGNIKLDSSFSRFVGDTVQLSGSPKHNASLQLQVVSPRQTYINLQVHLRECPPGFKLEQRTCVCNVDAYDGLLKCNVEKFYCHILPGYWAGVMPFPETDRSKLVTTRCPFCDYLKNSDYDNTSDFEIALPQNFSALNRFICGKTRTGIVCGKCADNYTVHFHSPGFKCKLAEPYGCNFGWLFYLISQFIPVTVLFVVILVLNISFTSGAVNGFILFSQLLYTFDLNASGIVKFPNKTSNVMTYWTEGHQVLYGAFNLDFFNAESLSFCLWRGANALDMVAVKYVTILYTLVLIAIVVFIMNKCAGKCCRNCCRISTIKTSVIHGMSSFLIICYAQCVKVSLSLLIPVSFNTEQNSSFYHPPHVWLNGELRYFHGWHLLYVFPALLCLLTIGLLPLILLLFYPLLTKVVTFLSLENSKVFAFISLILQINKLKPLIDSFQGCFKDDMRFFAGLYFLYRWTMMLIYISIKSYSVYYTAAIGSLVFMLALHSICQPYIKRAHNIIDTLLFCNIIFIASLSFFNYHKSYTKIQKGEGARVSPAIVQLVLIYTPLLIVAICILAMLCKYILDKRGRKNLLNSSNNTITLKEFIRNISTRDDDTDSCDEELTHDKLMDEDVQFLTGCDYVSAKTSRDISY